MIPKGSLPWPRQKEQVTSTISPSRAVQVHRFSRLSCCNWVIGLHHQELKDFSPFFFPGRPASSLGGMGGMMPDGLFFGHR